jgi:hypothetical protein
LRFRLSKISHITLRVSTGGRVVLRRAAVLGRGAHYFSWVPARAGRYTLQVAATDLAGNRGSTAGPLTVTRH